MMGGATDTEVPMTTQDPQLAPVQDEEDGEEDVEVVDLVEVSKKPSESSTKDSGCHRGAKRRLFDSPENIPESSPAPSIRNDPVNLPSSAPSNPTLRQRELVQTPQIEDTHLEGLPFNQLNGLVPLITNETHRALNTEQRYNALLRPIIQPKRTFMMVLKAKDDLPYHKLYNKLRDFVHQHMYEDQFLLVNCKHSGKNSCMKSTHHHIIEVAPLQEADIYIKCLKNFCEELHTPFGDRNLANDGKGGCGNFCQYVSPDGTIRQSSIETNRTVVDPDSGILLYIRAGYDSRQHHCKWYATIYPKEKNQLKAIWDCLPGEDTLMSVHKKKHPSCFEVSCVTKNVDGVIVDEFAMFQSDLV